MGFLINNQINLGIQSVVEWFDMRQFCLRFVIPTNIFWVIIWGYHIYFDDILANIVSLRSLTRICNQLASSKVLILDLRLGTVMLSCGLLHIKRLLEATS